MTVRHGQGVTVTDFRRTGTLELLGPFFETAPDLGEVTHIVEDLLPARLIVLEFATRLAIRRATDTDCQRLQDITELLIAAFDRGDRVLIAHGFHRWIDALVEASHSLTIRWVANPFLELYRDLIDRFPTLWLLDPGFPDHLRQLMQAFRAGDEERAIATTRKYYEGVNVELIRLLDALLSLKRHTAASKKAAEASAADRTKDSNTLTYELLNICSTEQNIRNYSFHHATMDASGEQLTPPTQSQSAACAKIAAKPLALEAIHYE